jgi:hypothetical protein
VIPAKEEDTPEARAVKIAAKIMRPPGSADTITNTMPQALHRREDPATSARDMAFGEARKELKKEEQNG